MKLRLLSTAAAVLIAMSGQLAVAQAAPGPMVTAGAERFLDLFFDETVMVPEIKAAVADKATKDGTERLEGLFKALHQHFEKPEAVNLILRDNGHYSLILKTEQNTYADLRMEISAETDFKVGAFQVTPHEKPLGNQHTGKSEIALLDAVDAHMEQLSANDDFSGTVLIAKNGRPIFKGFYGQANKETGRANTIDTPINLGSMNKTWTGVAIAQLVERGLLNWHDTVGKHIPDYPNKTVRDQVTVEMLLTHRSGLQAFGDDRDFDRYRETDNVEGLIDFVADNALAFEPGTGNQYSNAGPWLLGYMLERVTGQNYYDYIAENIFKPAGMANSGFYRKDDPSKGFAVGYLDGRRTGRAPVDPNLPKDWRSNYDVISLQGSPAGGAYASAPDLLRFANALQGGKLVKKETFDLLVTPHVKYEGRPSYGYLFGTREANGHFYWGHNGGAPGIQADFNHFPGTGYTLIVLSNYGSAALPVSRKLRHWFTSGETANASQQGT